MNINGEQLLEAAHKAGKWLASRQTEIGNFIGNEKPDGNGIYPDTHDVGCYYKSAHFLHAVGQRVAATKLMNYVVDSFMSPQGDFFNTPENRTSGSYTPTYCQPYPNLWLMRAASDMNRFDLAQILKHP